MNRAADTTRRRGHVKSTIAVDMGVRYPCAFTNMSISPYGRDVVLACQKGLAIVDLEFPLNPPRALHLDSLWKVAAVAWCPNIAHHGWVGTTVSQTLVIHDLAHTGGPMLVLKAHPKAITDIAWAPLIPAWIGTASIDPVVKIWDVRRDQKPVWYYTEWEPADKLAFNNVNMHQMATVHRNKIAVWDIRKGSAPLLTIPDAHADDVTSISWHPTLKDVLVSASLDCTVKRWSTEHHATEEYCHTFQHEVLAAKYLPFGEGLLVTQRSPDNRAMIIRDSAVVSVEHQFIGHEGTILGSEWRSHHEAGGGSMFQLVTWGQDQTLRMWTVDSPLMERIGGTVHRKQEHHYEKTPSFAANFLRPNDVMHFVAKKLLPSELLLAATNSTGAHRITTMHEFDQVGNMLESIRLVSTSDRPAERVVPLSGARTGTPDDHSSDDDDEMPAGGEGSGTAWLSEVEATVGMYRESKTVSVKEMDRDERQCWLVVGVPWITRETVHLQVMFPIEYPSVALELALETSGPAFSNGSSELLGRAAGTADACAAQGVKALHQCLYSLLSLLISYARAKSGLSTKQRDIERLPPPPPALLWEAVDGSSSQPRGSARKGRKAEMSDRSRSRSTGKRGSERVVPTSLTSEDNLSLLIHDAEEFYSDDESNDDEDEDEEEEEEEEEEDYDVFGFDAGYMSENSQSEVPVGMDGPLRHANNRDRYDAHTPFPRLCGGVFSGPGQLVCFFASIYTPDTYPDQGGVWQGRQKAYREEMSQQLRAQAKPRNLTRLNTYQNMVQLGLHSSGVFFSYPNNISAGEYSRGLDSDDDSDARDEEVPRYYFRQHAVSRPASVTSEVSGEKTYFRAKALARVAGSGVGNLALVCHVAEDASADVGLARQFVLAGESAEWVCRHNAQVAVACGKAGLAHTWTLLGCLMASSEGNAKLWASHPPVIKWLRSVMVHYERLGDVQTLALLACVLSQAAAPMATSDPVMASVAQAVLKNIAQQRSVKFKLPPEPAPVKGLGLTMEAEDEDNEHPDAYIHRIIDEALEKARCGVSVDATLGRRVTEDATSEDMQRTMVFLAAYPMCIVVKAPPLLGGSRLAPGVKSPEVLPELDSEEIKQNEIMMSEGIAQPVQPETRRASKHNAAQEVKAAEQRRNSSEPERSSSSPADGTENLWHRLRTNVLGRVHTVAVDKPAEPVAEKPGEWSESAHAHEPSKAPWVGRESVARAKDGVETYLRVRREYSLTRTRLVSHAASAEGCGERDYRSQAPYLDHWKLIYARILYKWEMDAKAVEVLKCIQDPDIRLMYNQLQSQPTVPQHDNLPRVGIAAISKPGKRAAAQAADVPGPGAPWLSCSWCHEYVHGRALICHACGHGGHQEHVIKWFRTARKNLKRIGLAPVNYSRFGSSNSSSSSNLQLGLLGKGSSALANIYSPELAPEPTPSVPEFTITSPTEDADRMLLLDMLPAGRSRRGSKGSVLSLASSDSSDSEADCMQGLGHDHQPDAQDWDSSDVESDDHLQQHQVLSSHGPKLPLNRRRGLESPLQQQRLDEAFAMQLEIPTCPTGCGCNCIYESRRLFM
ncbi:hypothetical protein H4R27_002893 [Coemansia aciculifera]|nr:hypothetical protein H4R27_002893 [Coemansia aciculifera]